MRITKKNLQAAWAIFLKTFRFRQAKKYNDVNGLSLVYQEFLGWRVEQVVSDTGGVNCPFGESYRTNGEMYDTLWFTIRVKEAKQRK